MQNKKLKISFLFLILFAFINGSDIFSQNTLNSPYSGFGFGEISTFAEHPYNSSLGGVSQAIRNGNMLNPSNPASFSAIRPGSFVFDMGFYGEISRLSANQAQAKTEGISNISHISFGFPILDRYKMSFGLMPFSGVNYSSTITEINETLLLGREKKTYTGSGGINKVYWGHGVQILKNLSVGINANLLFGKINKLTSLAFLDSTLFKSSYSEKLISIADLTGSIGAQYQLPLKNNQQITFGVTYDIPFKFNAKVEEARYSSSDISFQDEYKSSIVMPASYKGGIVYEKIDKWLVGVDIAYTEWSKHKFLDESIKNKENNFSAALGGELKGNLSAMKYWNRISWRGGVHFENAKYTLNDSPVKDMGVHLGASFPMRKAYSVFNLSVMYGRLGTTANELIQKDYIKVGISFSTSDRWFMKRKFD